MIKAERSMKSIFCHKVYKFFAHICQSEKEGQVKVLDVAELIANAAEL